MGRAAPTFIIKTTCPEGLMSSSIFRSASLAVVMAAASAASAAVHTENFDVDPGWNERQNRGVDGNNYGYATTNLAGGAAPGEICGPIASRTNNFTWYADI